MSSMSVSDLQRLQRLFAYLTKNISKLLDDCCAVIELIDEDDLTNWYILLKYSDENKEEFFLSLRICFFEELQRMPLVFVIAPRLIASFIHHGAICSLELMSQQWSVDAEGIVFLIRSLHATLNPFSHDSKVTVDEFNDAGTGGNEHNRLHAGNLMDAAVNPAPSLSAYTREEHELGIQHIRQSHPHLFRNSARRNNDNNNSNNSNNQQQPQQQEQEQMQRSLTTMTTTAVKNNMVDTTSSSVLCEENNTGKEALMKVIIHTKEELQELFFADALVDAQLDIQHRSLQNEIDHTTDGNENDNDDGSVMICTMPNVVNSIPTNYRMTIRPYKGRNNYEAVQRKSEENTAIETKVDLENDTFQVKEEKDPSLNGSGEIPHPRKNVDNQKVKYHRSPHHIPVVALDDEEDGVENKFHPRQDDRKGKNERIHKLMDEKNKYKEVELILTSEDMMTVMGGSTNSNSNNNLLPNAQKSRRPSSPCVIPAGCSLRLEHLTVYAAITVLGTLEMVDCTFVGYFSAEGNGHVGISNCNLYIDSPKRHREGILVLDNSTVEISNGTTVQRKENTFSDDENSYSPHSESSFSLLQAFILVSNSGTLRIHGGCYIAPYGTEKTIFAEQDAYIDIANCDVMAGCSSAVSILGCRAFFANTRFCGSDEIELQVSDINRPTGLNVELGGLVTARHCTAKYLYFGFSVIAHSVSYFYGCHAEHVVNGYTVDASSVTIENSSAHTNHVGVFVLNKAKCNISNNVDHIIPFEERCRELIKSRENEEYMRKLQLKGAVNVKEGEENEDMSNGAFSFVSSTVTTLQKPHASIENEDEKNSPFINDSFSAGETRKKPFISHIASASSSTSTTTPATAAAAAVRNSSMFPFSFKGGLFSLEVRDACMVAKGMVVMDAQDTSIYIYDKGSLTLSDVIVWKTLAVSQQPCGVKVVNSRANVQRCLVIDYSFGFAAIQGSVVNFEECMAVGGTNGFTVDDANCTLRYCGADTEHVGIFSLNQSTVFMDNSNAPKIIGGWLSCVLKGRLHGLESRSSETTCIGVTVQRGLDSGFTCYNGGCLRLEKCTVDMSTPPTSCSETITSDGVVSRRVFPSSVMDRSNSISTLGNGMALVSTDSNEKICNRGKVGGNVCLVTSSHDECPASLSSYNTQKNSGVKASSGSRCIAIGCEVRHVTFGYAAIGPETMLEAFHCTAKHIVNGFTVDSAKCRLSRCSTNSNHVGVFVLSHGTCTVRRGSYTARMYSIENRNGTVHIEGHVKLSGFSRIGLYVYDGARLDTREDSTLDIRVRKDLGRQQLPPVVAFVGNSANPSGLFPSCFAMDKGNAVIHNAYFGGGAQCAVSCGDGADVYLHQCKAEFCNVAFNALSGSQMYLSNCKAQHVRHHALIVRRGGVSRVNCQSPVSPASNILHGRLHIEGKCFLENVVLCPIPEVDSGASLTSKESHLLQSSSPATAGTTTLPSPKSSVSFTSIFPSTASLVASNSLIYVSSSGTLVMSLCLILLDEHEPISMEGLDSDEKVSARFVILAEGRKASVELHNVLFQKVFPPTVVPEGRSINASLSSCGSGLPLCNDSIHDSLNPLSTTIWYAVVLQQGAKGDIRGCTETSFITTSGSGGGGTNNTTATNSGIHGTAFMDGHPFNAALLGGCNETCSFPEECDTSINNNNNHHHHYHQHAQHNNKQGNDALFSSCSEIIPLRVYMAQGSLLFSENVNFRQLIASGGSRIDALRCFFAGADAVVLEQRSTLRASESLFVSAVRGAAVRMESSAVNLKKCRGYSTHKEIVVAKSSTLTIMESVFSMFFSLNTEESRRKLSCREQWLKTLSENSEDNEQGKCEELLIPRGSVALHQGNMSSIKNVLTTSAKQEDIAMSTTSPATSLALENITTEPSVGIPLSFPYLSDACTEDTHSDIVMHDITHQQTRNDCNVEQFSPVATEPIREEETIRENKSICEIKDSPLLIQGSGCMIKTTSASADSVVGRQFAGVGPSSSIRLEQSSLYTCRATVVEGGIAADATSRIETCRSSWLAGFVCLVKRAVSLIYET